MKESHIDFLYLNEEDMIRAGVTDMKGCVDAIEEMFRLMKLGDYRMGGANGNSHGVMMSFPEHPKFPNMPKDGPDRRFMAMPAYIGGKFDMAGVKWYGSNVENREKGLPRSILMVTLNDKETGAPVAYMSANLLSSYRTAAIPGVGVKLLSKEDSKIIAAIGPGAIQATQVETFAALRPSVDTIKIKGRGRASIDRFIDHIKETCPNIKNYIICDSIEECCKDADIITVAVSTPTGGHTNYPFIEREWIKPGCLVTSVGAVDFPDELVTDPNTLLVVDNKKLYEAWADEYPYPTFDKMFLLGDKFTDLAHDGKLDWDTVVNIGAIANGKVPGRTSDDQIILYSIGGMPVEDVAWGETVYHNALEKGIGTKLNLWDKPHLY